MIDEPLSDPKDKGRVDIDNEAEVRYWCRELKCKEEQLRNAVDRVGPLVDDVRRALSWGLVAPDDTFKGDTTHRRT